MRSFRHFAPDFRLAQRSRWPLLHGSHRPPTTVLSLVPKLHHACVLGNALVPATSLPGLLPPITSQPRLRSRTPFPSFPSCTWERPCPRNFVARPTATYRIVIPAPRPDTIHALTNTASAPLRPPVLVSPGYHECNPASATSSGHFQSLADAIPPAKPDTGSRPCASLENSRTDSTTTRSVPFPVVPTAVARCAA